MAARGAIWWVQYREQTFQRPSRFLLFSQSARSSRPQYEPEHCLLKTGNHKPGTDPLFRQVSRPIDFLGNQYDKHVLRGNKQLIRHGHDATRCEGAGTLLETQKPPIKPRLYVECVLSIYSAFSLQNLQVPFITKSISELLNPSGNAGFSMATDSRQTTELHSLQ